MIEPNLVNLRDAVLEKTKWNLNDYYNLGAEFLSFINVTHATRIISPSPKNRHYIFYQYGDEGHNRITRPLNTNLFIESPDEFKIVFERCMMFLDDIRIQQELVNTGSQSSSTSNVINKVIYTMQQAIGCIGDSLENSNQARKRIGQLFETLIKLLIQEVGVVCEPRTVNIPIPGFDGYKMSYELDVVFFRNKAILTSESDHKYIHPLEIVGSVKTTSKDRIDKVFLDKYSLTKLLEREVPVSSCMSTRRFAA